MQNLRFAVCAAIVLVLLALSPLVAAQCPSDSGDWLLFKDSCYKFYNESQFWFSAEKTCQASNGHLVSIRSDHENRLVGKMSLCQDSWTGCYGTDLKRLSNASSYAWTDENQVVDGAKLYEKHNFTESDTIHRILVRSMGLSWYNSLYHEQHPFMCKVRITVEYKPKCPSTMRFYQDKCYLLSGFEATFIEANFFCQNRSMHLASVLNEVELRFLNTIDLEVDSCMIQPMWLGLVKLNPCFPDRGGRELCYQWTDYSGKHLNFPRWADGQPTTEAMSEQDCVIIAKDQLSSAKCTERHKFVCITSASSLTPGSPAWQALDEPPKPIDESKVEKVNVESTVASTPDATVAPDTSATTAAPDASAATFAPDTSAATVAPDTSAAAPIAPTEAEKAEEKASAVPEEAGKVLEQIPTPPPSTEPPMPMPPAQPPKDLENEPVFARPY